MRSSWQASAWWLGSQLLDLALTALVNCPSGAASWPKLGNHLDASGLPLQICPLEHGHALVMQLRSWFDQFCRDASDTITVAESNCFKFLDSATKLVKAQYNDWLSNLQLRISFFSNPCDPGVKWHADQGIIEGAAQLHACWTWASSNELALAS